MQIDSGRKTDQSADTTAKQQDFVRKLNPMKNKSKDSIDLGLALLSCATKGEPLTADDIAAWSDCSHQVIYSIERRAIRKLRAAIYREFGVTAQELLMTEQWGR